MCLFAISGFLFLEPDLARGIIFGGLIATINFHMLKKTLKKGLTPPHISSHNVIIAKYFMRFVISGFILFLLISMHYANPIGLLVGLSVVVVSITLAAFHELKIIIFKEAV